MGWYTQPPVYNDHFFTTNWFVNWVQLRPILKQLLETEPRWKQILDFGCGPGVMIDYMGEAGYLYLGVDPMEEPKALYQQHFGRFPERYRSSIPCSIPFDLCLSFDVLEHLSDLEISTFLAQVKQTPDLLVNISREKWIPGHINLKSDEQWIAFFAKQGFSFDRHTTTRLRAEYLNLRPQGEDKWHQNLFLFHPFV